MIWRAIGIGILLAAGYVVVWTLSPETLGLPPWEVPHE